MGDPALVGGRYELGAALGSGGFATVFRARDREAGADVAVKLVPPGFDGERLAGSLRTEAAILKRLSSRHLARVYDLGADAHGVWLVTELIDGVSLSVEGLGRALLPHEVLRVARGLLEGLSVAHAAGVIHGDVKPSNVLVPRTDKALDGPKLIDFGLARLMPRHELARELGEGAPSSGVVMGSARWMAPEVLSGSATDMRADVYAAGLVLFELLGVGDLFPAADRPAQLRARVEGEPLLEGRVPEPLASVLTRMLARDPARRFRDASEALGAIIDLDTAPVSTVRDDEPPSMRASQPSFPFRPSMMPPPPGPRSLAPRETHEPGYPRFVSPPSRPISTRPPRPVRLTGLPEDGFDGLRETLRHLDLPMLDALARRERGSPVGRIARSVALALRLELDAAALILEPLALSSDVARAVGATILAPRARRVTRARVDPDRDDGWVETVPVELGGLLAAFATALSGHEEATRDAARCARLLDRLDRAWETAEPDTQRRIDPLRITLRIAIAAARVRTGELTSGAGMDLVAPLETVEGLPRTAFDRVVRPLLAAAIGVRVDEGSARDELERAVRAATESGATLLEARASSTWGRLLIDAPRRIAQGLGILERATTLLAHGDAPSLEHEAEHHRAAALIVLGRWNEAVAPLRAAREAAHAERADEAEVLSASLEVIAHLALGDHDPAREAAAALGRARIGTARGRAAAFAWIARCLEALASGDREGAEDALAEASARSREAGVDGADAYVIVEVLAIVLEAGRGAVPDVMGPAAELERFAAERGFTSFYWFDVLRTVIERVDDPRARARMQDVLDRIALLLGPASRNTRDRRTSAPPGMGPA